MTEKKSLLNFSEYVLLQGFQRLCKTENFIVRFKNWTVSISALCWTVCGRTQRKSATSSSIYGRCFSMPRPLSAIIIRPLWRMTWQAAHLRQRSRTTPIHSDRAKACNHPQPQKGGFFIIAQHQRMQKLSTTTKRTLRGSFRTRADSTTDNRAKLSGGKKKFNENVIEIWA